MKAASRTILWGTVIFVVLASVLLCSVFVQGWYFGSGTRVISFEPFQYWKINADELETRSHVELETGAHPMTLREFYKQQGWEFWDTNSCEYVRIVDLGLFYIQVYKTLVYSETTPVTITFNEFYTIRKTRR